MKGRDFILLTLVIVKGHVMTLSDDEQKLSASLMDALSIYHRILLEDPNFELKNLKIFKRSIFWGKGTTYQNTNQILKYLRKKVFPDPSTLIIFKPEKLKTVVTLLQKLTKMKKSHSVAKFTWLVFVESYDAIEKDENDLLVPVNADFIIAYPLNSTSYKLTEIYKIKSKTVRLDFGDWHEGKLEITDVPWHKMRNFKNETLIMGGLTEYGDLGQCLFPRQCVTLIFVETLSTALNFSLEWVKFSTSTWHEHIHKVDIMDILADTSFFQEFLQLYFEASSQIFTSLINWYIREPSSGQRADFYVQPFGEDFWASILITIIIGGLMTTFITYLLKTVAGENGRKIYQLKDHFFMPIDCFCNQEGTNTEDRNPSRILCFSIRFLALFVFGAYSATITSYSALREAEIPFRNLDEFLEKEEYSIVQHSAFKMVFSEDQTDKSWRALLKKMHFTDYTSDTMDKVCTESFATAFAQNDVESCDCSCKLYQIEKPLMVTFMFACLSKNSPYKKIINHFLIDFYSSGIRHYLHQASFNNPNLYHRVHATESANQLPNWRYDRFGQIVQSEERDEGWQQKCIISTAEVLDFDEVKFQQITQILAIFGVGVLISVAIFANEIIFSYSCKKFKERKPFQLKIGTSISKG